MPEKLATDMMHWCIDCGAQLTRAKPPIHCTMGNKKIYIMEISQCQTKCSLSNSISGATGNGALSLHSTCIHRQSVGRGTCPPPKKIFTGFALGEGTHAPQNFYRIHNDLESLFENNKQFLQNLFKIFLKFSKISNILYKFAKFS